MAIIRPRLTDHYGVLVSQAAVDFAIPFLDEDIPLFVDPFLLWKSPSQQDQSLHTAIVNSFNNLGHRWKTGDKENAKRILISSSECDEVGLGLSHTKHGQRIGASAAESILSLFDDIPEYNKHGFVHFEEIQMFVDQIARDRISDITCSFVKSFLIDFTIDACYRYSIPVEDVSLPVYDYRQNDFANERTTLPVSPEDKKPIIFVPKRWLRRIQWLNFDDYFENCVPAESPTAKPSRVKVLTYNRHHFDEVRGYIAAKEREKSSCHNDPLFTQIPIISARAGLGAIRKLPTGINDSNDKKYERETSRLMASLLYPQLDFADTQSRVESGALIRDLIFYNNQAHPFLREIYDKYASHQLVFELKNVKEIEREHINQLHRYLKDQFGKFGVLLTRNPLSRAMLKNTIDLWAGQRVCIIAVTDSDLDIMVELYDAKQRDPLDVLKKNYVEFTRACPS